MVLGEMGINPLYRRAKFPVGALAMLLTMARFESVFQA
jgi:hypothetical protein